MRRPPEEVTVQAKARIRLQQHYLREALAPKYDWYAPDCPCGVPPGTCKEHPRARLNEWRTLPDGTKALFGQRPPAGPWKVWMYCGGRGVGKSICGAQWIVDEVKNGRARSIALVSETMADVRDVMVDALCSDKVSPPWFKPHFSPTNRSVVWPNGARALMFSAERPDLLRGPQHDRFWFDELGKCRFNQQDTWDNLELGLRVGPDPCGIVTSTPRPTDTFKMLLRHPDTAVTRGTTYDNASQLPESFIRRIEQRFAGTRQGRQEIEAQLLEDMPGALWTHAMIDDHRREAPGDLIRVVVAIDPSAGSNDPESAAEAGIIAAGVDRDHRVYILEDASLKGSPQEWATEAVTCYRRWSADRIVAEVNNGGDMVGTVLGMVDPTVPFRKLWASRGKVTRAEPVAALYEQGRIHHARVFPDLEAQLTGWVPGMASPDRLDALVWAVTELVIDGGGVTEVEDDPYQGMRI